MCHVYIEGFAGAGVHIARASNEFVLGSPLNALNVKPPFREYFLVDIQPEKVEFLQNLVGAKPNVHVYPGDCNQILLERVFPQVRYEDYRRGLCILDPYGLDLRWLVTNAAGQMKSLDIFLNFPVEDINRNVLWRDPRRVNASQSARMTAFWGDESWRDIAYKPQGLFGWNQKEPNEAVAEAFRLRLQTVAGFKRVPSPLPMRNSKGATVYYLFFASQKPAAEDIILDIFNKYRDRRG